MNSEREYGLVLVENVLWVLTSPAGMPRYDFSFEQFFACRHPFKREDVVTAVARMGATGEYPDRYQRLLADGIRLIHTPAEYERTSELPGWYPLIRDLTPRSIWFRQRPTAQEISATFKWPVFVKGERQTSKHQRHMSILEGPNDFERVMDAWDADSILRWQQVVCREYVNLRLVGEQSNLTMPRAFEFRSFWWKGECVGIGQYWVDERYELTQQERADALAIGSEAARRVGVTFLVVDLAQTADGRWIVIECNDGQDAGHAGIPPLLMWRRIVDLERA